MRDLKLNYLEVEVDGVCYYLNYKDEFCGAYWCDCPADMPIKLFKYFEKVGIECKKIIQDWEDGNV